jgi:hypothetical protein
MVGIIVHITAGIMEQGGPHMVLVGHTEDHHTTQDTAVQYTMDITEYIGDQQVCQ